ncbi:SDR family NAD(P)-dependent oxidoreductase [Brevundimonas lutea]|uniref:SDR family NAD(P)-dependent oxidoreductase n=1 Tax=Brevundimonas lutea TaxID=2293980 RepID=UPI000F016C04|nr:SDR family NAD(P)-dependent oxidoreductase [Brevundimonas lutea]
MSEAAERAGGRPKVALITGASAGIGAAFATLLASQGWSVILTARREIQLEFVASECRRLGAPKVWKIPLDLSLPKAPEALALALIAERAIPDALINNAGYSRTDGFLSSAPEAHDAMLRLMLQAPVTLSRLLAPAMVERGYGRIVNVASLAGFLPATGGDTLYGPIKSFLIRASRGLNLELQGTGVHVSALCPGYTLTEFHDANGSRDQVSRAYPDWMWMTAEAVVAAGWRGVEANRLVVVPGLLNKTVAAVSAVLPEPLAMAMVKSQARRLKRL